MVHFRARLYLRTIEINLVEQTLRTFPRTILARATAGSFAALGVAFIVRLPDIYGLVFAVAAAMVAIVCLTLPSMESRSIDVCFRTFTYRVNGAPPVRFTRLEVSPADDRVSLFLLGRGAPVEALTLGPEEVHCAHALASALVRGDGAANLPRLEAAFLEAETNAFGWWISTFGVVVLVALGVGFGVEAD